GDDGACDRETDEGEARVEEIHEWVEQPGMVHPFVARHRPRVDVVAQHPAVGEEVLTVAVVPAPVEVRVRKRGEDEEGHVHQRRGEALPRSGRGGNPRLASASLAWHEWLPRPADGAHSGGLRPAADPALHEPTPLRPAELEVEAPDLELLVRI